jgi:hypothetical protein
VPEPRNFRPRISPKLRKESPGIRLRGKAACIRPGSRGFHIGGTCPSAMVNADARCRYWAKRPGRVSRWAAGASCGGGSCSFYRGSILTTGRPARQGRDGLWGGGEAISRRQRELPYACSVEAEAPRAVELRLNAGHLRRPHPSVPPDWPARYLPAGPLSANRAFLGGLPPWYLTARGHLREAGMYPGLPPLPPPRNLACGGRQQRAGVCF